MPSNRLRQYQAMKRSTPTADFQSLLGGQEQGFIPTQPGDPDFGLSTTPSSQAQFPAAAAEKRLYETRTRATNTLEQAEQAGFDVWQPQYQPIREASERGFLQDALTMGENLINFIDGPREAVNLMFQDLLDGGFGGSEGDVERQPGIRDYLDALWLGIEDQQGFEEATGLKPDSGSHTIDMLGWDEAETWYGKAARGIATFGFEVVTDPLTYVTFGLSGLGRKVAKETAERVEKNLMDEIIPAFKNGTLDPNKISSEYGRRLARNLEDIHNDFVEKHLSGEMDPSVMRALKRYLSDTKGLEVPDDPWAMMQIVQDNLTELALKNRMRDDLMIPLLRRDFAAMPKEARELLPKFAWGGARISIPFTQKGLTHGIYIPGTAGLGRKLVGNHLRKISAKMKDVLPGYNKLTKAMKSVAANLDQDKYLLDGLVREGGIEGWQYGILQGATDNMENAAARQQIISHLNALGKQVRKLSEDAGADEGDVWGHVMARLQNTEGGNFARQAVENAVGGTGEQVALDDALTQKANELADYLRSTLDSYHSALAEFDESVVDQYLNNYVPHVVDPEIGAVLGELAGKGNVLSRREWEALQAEGNPGGVLLDQILNAIGKGGRIETQMGASRYFNERTGRLNALTLTDQGAVLFDADYLGGLRRGSGILDEGGGVVEDALQSTYYTVEQLNEMIGPLVKRLAEENGVKLPKNWSGQVFKTNPLEIAEGYINNLDEVLKAWHMMDAMRTAGLAFEHSSAPNVQNMLQAMYRNIISNLEQVETTTWGKPTSETKTAPVEWLEGIVDEVDWERAGQREVVLDPAVIDETRPVGERMVRRSTKGSFEELKESIRRDGMNQPVVVTIDIAGRPVVMDGHNRLRAAKELGMDEVPVVYRLSQGADEVATSQGHDSLRGHMKNDLVMQNEPLNITGEDVPIPPRPLPDDVDQNARLMRNRIARTNDQSRHIKDRLSRYVMGDRDPADFPADEVDRMEDLMRWWTRQSEQTPELVRATNQAELDEILEIGEGGTYTYALESASPRGTFADSARGEGWRVEFDDGTHAAWNDLNNIEGDEHFVSGEFRIDEIDENAKVVRMTQTDPDAASRMLDLDIEEYRPQTRTIDATDAPPTAENTPALFHGSRGDMTEDLVSVEEAGRRGQASSENLFGPGFYSTDSPRVAGTPGYGGGREGAVSRLEWRGQEAPVIMNLSEEAVDEPFVSTILRVARKHLGVEDDHVRRARWEDRGEGQKDLVAYMANGEERTVATAIDGAGEQGSWRVIVDTDDPTVGGAVVGFDDVSMSGAYEGIDDELQDVVEAYLDYQGDTLVTASKANKLEQLEDAVRGARSKEEAYEATRNVAHEYGYQDADEFYLELNKSIRDDLGVDAMTHHGGVRAGGGRRQHNAYIWLNTEDIRLVDEPAVREFRRVADSRRAREMGFESVEELDRWRAQGAPDAGPPGRGGSERTAEEIFDTLPWDARVREKNVLKGFEEASLGGKAVPIEFAQEAKRAGFNSLDELAEVGQLLDDEVLNNMVDVDKRGLLAESMRRLPNSYIEDLDGVSVAVTNQTIEQLAEEGGTQGVKVVRMADGTMRHLDVRVHDRNGAVVALTWDVKDGAITDIQSVYDIGSLRRHKATGREWADGEQEAVRMIAEAFKEHGLRAESLRRLLVDQVGKGSTTIDTVDHVMQAARKVVSELSPPLREAMTGKPAELVGFESHYDAFMTEINNLFREMSVFYDPENGKFITEAQGRRLGEIAGDDAFINRIKELRKIAQNLSDEHGFEAAMKIFRGMDDYIGVADSPGFVNPRWFALGGPAIEGMTIQPDIGNWIKQLARNQASIYTPEGVAAAKLATNSVLKWWKAMATIARPGFHVRNTVGGIWNNMIIGVSPADYLAVRNHGLKMRAALQDPNVNSFDEALARLPVKERAYWKAAYENDVLSGFVSNEFRKLTVPQKAERFAWGKVWDIDNFALTRAGGKFMESIEDFLRMSAFRAWYDPNDPATAGIAKAMVEAVHFNYSKLTPLEQKLKQFVPFFVWSRRNLPLQLAQLAENPRMIQRYRAMLNAIDDQNEDDLSQYPNADWHSAFAADTGFTVNAGTPFWARVMIDPDLPVRDLVDLPMPDPKGVFEFANNLLGPHVTTLIDINNQRDFGEVNAPAPMSGVLKSLAAVGFFDTTMDGDVRVPYWARTVMETALPPGRDVLGPLTGGPNDPSRQQREGISPDDGPVEAGLKSAGATLGRALGVQFSGPQDTRAVAGRSNAQLNEIIEAMRLEGELPPSERDGGGSSLISTLGR